MMHATDIRRKILSSAVTMAVCCFSGTALATAITYGPASGPNIILDATYSLGTTNNDQNGMVEPPASFYTNPGSIGADMFLSNGSGADSVFFHTYGFTGDLTNFGARASGIGTFAASTQASYIGQFTNTSSTALPFTFSFQVENGEVGLFGGGNGLAELILKITTIRSSGSTVVSQSKTTIGMTNGVTTCTEDDTGGLTDYMECGDFTDNKAAAIQRSFSVDLGLFDPNELFTVRYDIIANVSGSLTGDSCGGSENGNTATESATAATLEVCGGEGIARSGDPYSVPPSVARVIEKNGTPIDGFAPANFAVTAGEQTVPEPGSLALLSIAGVAAGAALRRKHAHKK